jgi:hypothetical protein
LSGKSGSGGKAKSFAEGSKSDIFAYTKVVQEDQSGCDKFNRPRPFASMAESPVDNTKI